MSCEPYVKANEADAKVCRVIGTIHGDGGMTLRPPACRVPYPKFVSAAVHLQQLAAEVGATEPHPRDNTVTADNAQLPSSGKVTPTVDASEVTIPDASSIG